MTSSHGDSSDRTVNRPAAILTQPVSAILHKLFDSTPRSSGPVFTTDESAPNGRVLVRRILAPSGPASADRSEESTTSTDLPGCTPAIEQAREPVPAFRNRQELHGTGFLQAGCDRSVDTSGDSGEI